MPRRKKTIKKKEEDSRLIQGNFTKEDLQKQFGRDVESIVNYLGLKESHFNQNMASFQTSVFRRFPKTKTGLSEASKYWGKILNSVEKLPEKKKQ